MLNTVPHWRVLAPLFAKCQAAKMRQIYDLHVGLIRYSLSQTVYNQTPSMRNSSSFSRSGQRGRHSQSLKEHLLQINCEVNDLCAGINSLTSWLSCTVFGYFNFLQLSNSTFPEILAWNGQFLKGHEFSCWPWTGERRTLKGNWEFGAWQFENHLCKNDLCKIWIDGIRFAIQRFPCSSNKPWLDPEPCNETIQASWWMGWDHCRKGASVCHLIGRFDLGLGFHFESSF